MAATRPRVLGLYKSVLRANRQAVPPVMQETANKFVRLEFEQHKGIKEPSHIQEFIRGWEEYIEQLEKTKSDDGSVGRNLTRDEVAKLTEDQAMRVVTLKDEIDKKKAAE